MKKSLTIILVLFVAIAVVYWANEYASDTVEANIEPSVRDFLEQHNGRYDSLDYDVLTNVLVIRNLSFEPNEATSQRVEIARVELRGADMANMQRVFDPPAGVDLNNRQKFYDLWSELVIEGLSVDNAERSNRIGKISLRDLQMKPLDGTSADLVMDGLLRAEDVAAVLLSVRFDALSIQDFRETTNRVPQIEAVRLIEMRQFDAGAIWKIQIEGLSGTTDDGDDVTMRALEVTALDLTRDLRLAGERMRRGENVFHDTAFETLRAEGIELIESDMIRPVRLEALIITELTLGRDIPASLSFELKAFDLPLETAEEISSQSGLAELGYTKIVLDLAYQATYDEKARRLAVQNLSVAIVDMAEIEFSGILHDVGPDDFTTEFDLSMLGSGVKLAEAHLHYADGSLIERLYEREARSRGIAKERIQAEIINRLGDQKMFFQLAPNGTATLAALKAFVKDPQTITIHVQPAVPIALGPLAIGALLSPQLALMTLNVTVTAND